MGAAIRDSGLPREDIFLTSKLWPPDYPYDKAVAAIERTLKRLGTDYVDLLLLHQQYGDYKGAWRAMEEAVAAGKVRALGVSNFNQQRFTDLAATRRSCRRWRRWSVIPTISSANSRRSWPSSAPRSRPGTRSGTPIADFSPNPVRPAGGEARQVARSGHPALAHAGGEHRDPPVDDPAHIASNIEIFDFALAPDEMASIAELDRNKPFFRMPDFVGRIIFPAARIDFDKRQR